MLTVVLIITGVLLAIVLFWCVFFVAAARLEKHQIPSLVELPARQAPILTPYIEAMNRGAEEAGFMRGETAVRAKADRSRVTNCFWVSPDRSSMAVVSGGRLALVRHSRTELISRLREGSLLMTADLPLDHGTDLERFKLLVNADFAELLALHRSRLKEPGIGSTALLDDSPLAEFSKHEMRVADWLASRGYLRCIDPSGTIWRHTLRGALRLFRRTHSIRRHCPPGQWARFGRPVPGTPKYEAMRDVALERSVRIRLDSPYLLYFDPMALDELRNTLVGIPVTEDGPSRELLDRLHRELEVGYCRVDDFRPGEYEIGPADLDESPTEEQRRSVNWAGTDSATLILVDYAHAAALVEILDWRAYDLALQAPLGDDSAFAAIAERIGGRYFAVMEVGADGAYRVPPEAPRRVADAPPQDSASPGAAMS